MKKTLFLISIALSLILSCKTDEKQILKWREQQVERHLNFLTCGGQLSLNYDLYKEVFAPIKNGSCKIKIDTLCFTALKGDSLNTSILVRDKDTFDVKFFPLKNDLLKIEMVGINKRCKKPT
jgi:hypothetical protein